MADKTWIGSATPTTDVWTLTVGGTIEANDVFTATIGSKTLTVVPGVTVAADVATAFAAAWSALSSRDFPEFAEYSALAASATIVLTQRKAGVPGTISVATTETGGGAADAQTFGASNTTPATGPNFWNAAANWLEGSVPVNTNDVIFEDSDVDVLYGLDQSAVTLNSLKFRSTYTGRVGLPRYNESGKYYEYREHYLKVGPTTLTVGDGEGEGSGRININAGSVACACTVSQTGQRAEGGIPAVLFKGTSASNALNVTKGDVGVAIYSGETANLSGGLSLGYEGNQASDSFVWCGPGVTFATVNQFGGNLLTESNITTMNRAAGTQTHGGAGTIGTLTNRGGTFFHESSGTITTLTNLGIFDRRRTTKSGTITNVVALHKGSSFLDPEGTLTLSAGYQTVQCTTADVTVVTGRNKTYTIS